MLSPSELDNLGPHQLEVLATHDGASAALRSAAAKLLHKKWPDSSEDKAVVRRVETDPMLRGEQQ